MQYSKSFWQRFDFVLFAATMLLIIFGVLMIGSATHNAVDTDLISRVPDQIRYAGIGVVLVFGLAAVDYRLLGGLHMWLYLLMVGLLLLVVLLGVVGAAGAQRWINVGIRIQPSELGKVIIIITLGNFLSEHYQEMDRISTVIKSFIHLAVPAGLVFIQPDLGTTIVFVVIWLVMLWGAGLRLKHIAWFMMLLMIVAPIVWTQMEDYQKSRITTFIDPESDKDAQYNIDQALISVGSGGVLGKGYLNGTQSQLRFLRVRHTDFIFSVVAEEFGMVGGMFVMGLIGVVIMRVLRGARLAADPLGSLICYGVATIIFFQTVVSIGMNLNLMPVTGLPLPFVSSGGTSLMSILMGVGLAESVIVRRRRV
jgi:rod shape determining protein RodA